MTTTAKVTVTKIEWDTDGEAVAGLPTEMEVEIDLNDGISDALSDATDWCVSDYEIASVVVVG